MISYFANPSRFLKIAGPLALLFGVVGFAGVGWAWWTGLTAVPLEQDQGDLVRIMFAHVPAAWVALGAYAFMAGASFVYYVWRHSLADEAAKAAAPMGALCALVTLLTGAIWGQPTWGVWWAWDARMTSMLILFLLYIGYFALRAGFDDQAKAARGAAILCMVGVVMLPIIKYSVEIRAFNTVHQPSGVFASATDAVFQAPVYIAGLGFLLIFVSNVLWLMRSAVIARAAEARTRRARSRAVITEVTEGQA